MSEYIIKEVNVETGDEIVREATAEEVERIETSKVVEAEKMAQAEAKAAARQAILDRLGLTEEEARLLLG